MLPSEEEEWEQGKKIIVYIPRRCTNKKVQGTF